MPVFSVSRSDIRQAVGRQTGHLFGRRLYTVTAATNASGIGGGGGYLDLVDLPVPSPSRVTGLVGYVPTGGGNTTVGRTVVSALTGSPVGVPSGTRLYWDRVFSPVPSTNALMELWEGVNPDTINQFIADAVKQAGRTFLDHKEDYAIQLDDLLGHRGSFERWPGGAAAVPDGWSEASGAGAVARESTIIYKGRFSLRQRNTASNAYVLETEDLPGFPRLGGKTVTAKAKLFTVAGSRIRLNIDDGVSVTNGTQANGTGGTGTDAWEEVSAEKTLSNALTKLRVQLDIATGGQITAYWGKVWLEIDEHIYEFDLPESSTGDTGFAYLSEVWLESDAQAGVYNVRLPIDYWDVSRDTYPRKLILRKGWTEHLMTAGRGVKLVGQRFPRVPTADSDMMEVDPEYLRRAVLVNVLDSTTRSEMDRSRRDRWAKEAQDYLRDHQAAVYPDAVQVEI